MNQGGPGKSPALSTPSAAPHVTSARSILRFLGARVTTWYLVGGVGALLLGIIELAIAVFLQLFLQSLGLLPAQAAGWSIVRYIPATPLFVGTLLCAIAAVRALGQFLVTQSAVTASETLQARMRKMLAFEMLLHPRGRGLPASEVNARLSDTLPRATAAAFWFAGLAGGILQASIVALVMLVSVWREALLGVMGLGVVGLLVVGITRRIRREVGEIPLQQRAITAAIQRVARNAFLVRVLRTERREHAVFLSSITFVERQAIRAGVLSNIASALPPFLGTILVMVLITFGIRVLQTPSAMLISFLYLFVRMVQSISVVVTGLGAIYQYWPQFREADTLFAAFTDAEVSAAQPEQPVTPRALSPARPPSEPPKPPRIAVNGVSFAYSPDAPRVFDGVSLALEGGTFFGITGPSGCGKSTLLSLILGDLTPTAGEVTIDGVSPDEYFARPDIRVGYVGAEPFLIGGTIRDNLLYGCPREVTEADIVDALERAHLMVAIERMPDKLEHRISETGAGLSAGQQQRLCLARALLAAPDLLVLDEASANLDLATEAEVAESIRLLKGACTVIAVSHRPGLLRYADGTLALG